MLTQFVPKYLGMAQNQLINYQNEYAKNRSVLGRVSVIPVALFDVALQTLKTPLWAIERIVVAAMNLVGILFHQNCNLRDSLVCIQGAGELLVSLAVVIPFVPVTLSIRSLQESTIQTICCQPVTG